MLVVVVLGTVVVAMVLVAGLGRADGPGRAVGVDVELADETIEAHVVDTDRASAFDTPLRDPSGKSPSAAVASGTSSLGPFDAPFARRTVGAVAPRPAGRPTARPRPTAGGPVRAPRPRPATRPVAPPRPAAPAPVEPQPAAPEPAAAGPAAPAPTRPTPNPNANPAAGSGAGGGGNPPVSAPGADGALPGAGNGNGRPASTLVETIEAVGRLA